MYQNPDLALETRISDSGSISYPLLGDVKLGGLTVSAAEKKLAAGLRDGNFLKQPQVSLLVLQVKANQVSVLGQVNRPGRYALRQVPPSSAKCWPWLAALCRWRVPTS